MLEALTVKREGAVVFASAKSGGNAIPVLVGMLLPSIQQARVAARRSVSMNNLKQIALCLHNYHDSNGHFPPAKVLGPDGKTIHSWRVAILPYLGEQKLFAEYGLNEPWDSQHNIKVAQKMPNAYRNPQSDKQGTATSYFAFVGAETAFGHGEDGIKLRDITDGISKTILVVEAKRDIPWSKPEDLEFHPKGKLPAIGGFSPTGFNAALCDGSVLFLQHNTVKDILPNLITRAGKEAVEILQIIRPVNGPVPVDKPIR